MVTLRRLWTLPWSLAAAAAVTAAAAVDGRAQDGTITGGVVSTVARESGEPVPGVTVRLTGLQLARISDEAGRFEFRGVPPGTHELRAELLGCLLGSRVVEVEADETVDVDFGVSRPAIELPGIVATGVSAGAPDAERTFSVGRVDVEEREGSGGRSIVDLIRGEFPSVRIRERGGAAGEISIQLRGPTSISRSEQPLLVIDGITTGGGFVDLNPGDVTSVRVLRGAGAAAEYGSRGEAGVIEITTTDQGRDPAPEPGPVVVVDGEISEEGLRPVDSDSIQGMEMVTDARAGVLFGGGARERGVLRVTTKKGADERDRNVLTRCIAPPP